VLAWTMEEASTSEVLAPLLSAVSMQCINLGCPDCTQDKQDRPCPLASKRMGQPCGQSLQVMSFRFLLSVLTEATIGMSSLSAS
jgi:hypothetical protein